MSIGIFGGTFDPPHLGHLILADEALAQLGLEQVLFVLTGYPPHKHRQVITPVDTRRALLEAAIADNPEFSISRVDIDRPVPHYAVDTVRLTANEYPGKEIIYLMGGDSLRDLPNWHTPEEFIEACAAIGVMRRPGEQYNLKQLTQILPGLKKKVKMIYTPLIEVSSSAIRARIAEGLPYRYYLPPVVYSLIQQQALYR